MAGRSKLYRLLRDDEHPFEDGITAKRPFANDTPLMHIRNGSRRSSQWISTSRSLNDIDNLIKLKRKREGMFVMFGIVSSCRVVEIDAQKLQEYAGMHRREMQQLGNRITETEGEMIFRMNLASLITETTGQILDFTNQNTMDKYIPRHNRRARGYARKYSEVLVERFIPADCCIAVYDR